MTSAQHLPQLLGIELDDVSAERVTARLPVRPELLAPNGYLHAATVVGLADSACGYGTLVGLPQSAAGFTTIELKANMMATARDGVLECVATRRHGGSTTQVWDAEVRSGERLLALFRCTQLVLAERTPTRRNEASQNA